MKKLSAVEQRANLTVTYLAMFGRLVREQVRPVMGVLIVSYLAAVVALGAAVVLSIGTSTPLFHFMGDPARVASHPPYVGLISNFGALLWCSSAAILIFSAVLLSHLGQRGVGRFLFASGLVTSVLLIDDFFMIHEKASEIYWRLSEEAIFIGYGLMLMLYLARFRKQILETRYLPLALAFGFMGISLFVDQVFGDHNVDRPIVALVEDGTKFLAITSWLVYFARVSVQYVLDSIREAQGKDAHA